MNKVFKSILVLLIISVFVSFVSCSPVETGSETQDNSSTENSDAKYKNIEVPQISSEDPIMPTYFDISLYNVENYSDIYLGKNFKYKITYAGNSIEVPTTYKKMTAKGFNLIESEEYDEKSIILAGKTMNATFVNEYGNKLDAVFYNASNSSVELRNCRIVKFKISENNQFVEDSSYGQFFVNGVTNQSAITDIIEYLGAPSHFYAVNENEYYLDYFLSKDDLRSRITVYITPQEDCIKSIEFSKYN